MRITIHAATHGIQPRRPIAVIRLDDLSPAVEIGRALTEGGVSALEFTLTNRRALAAVEDARGALGDAAFVGAGTVLDAESARAAILSGAQFLVTPTLAPDVIASGRSYGVPVLCGAMTPTEILAAHRAGAEYVKVFPARGLGPTFVKDVLGPLPGIRLVPTGGIDLENCGAFLDAGAYAVAVGGSLFPPDLVATGDWAAISALAGKYVAACSKAQGG